MSIHACFARSRRLTRLLPLLVASIVHSMLGSMLSARTLRAQQERGVNPSVTRSLSGIVRDETRLPVAGARLALVGTPLVAFTNDSGAYRFAAPPSGVYTVRVLRIGFAPVVIDSVVIASEGMTVRDFQLAAKVPALSQVTITPGAFTLLDATAPSRLSLTREALLSAPQLAEDIFRSLNRLPGLSGSDFSAKIRIRNGGVDEQLYTLDGLELIEPFHLKDFDGALSILDGEVIGRVAVTTGGFTAASGNRMAGVVAMESAVPSGERRRTAVGLSISNVRARSEGTFDKGKGSWLVSGRRGYLDVVLRLIGTDNPPDPRYADLFGKVQYRLSPNHIATIHGLVGSDDLRLTSDGGSVITSTYGNRYVWGTLKSQFGERVSATSMLSLSSLSWRRDVSDVERFFGTRYERVRIADRRALRALALKQDWSADLSPEWSVLFGGELRAEDAAYAYGRTQVARGTVGNAVVVLDSVRVAADLQPVGTRSSAYASVRARPVHALTIEVGGRVDRHGWTRQTTVSPRTNVAWTATPSTTLRAAWGHYHQAHTLQDLAVVDGDTAFARAERAEHRVIGVERELGAGWTARAEGYQRVLRSPRARFVNIDGNAQSPLPEGDLDRVRFAPSSADVRGIELLAQYDRGGRVRGGASLVRSRATAVIAGIRTPRPFDEPLAAAADIAYRTARGWTLAASFTARSGWPIVGPSFAIDTLGVGRYVARRLPSSPYFNERLGNYQRVDVRVSRAWDTRRGRVNVWGDVFNVLNRKNQQGYSYEWALASPTLVNVFRGREDFLGCLPTVGVGWEF